jgi:uncharacterized membrane protein
MSESDWAKGSRPLSRCLFAASIIFYGLASGSLLMLATSEVFGVSLPCGVDNHCAVFQASPYGRLFGLPTAAVAFPIVLAVTAMACFGIQRRPTVVLSLSAVAYSAWIQFHAYNLFGFMCGWCFATAAFLLVGAVLVGTAKGRPSQSWPLAAIGALIPVVLLPIIPTRSQGMPIALKRDQVLSGLDSPGKSLVVFGSPICPACLAELDSLVEQGGTGSVTYRFIGTSKDPAEEVLAARLKYAFGKRDSTLMKQFDPKGSVSLVMQATQKMIPDHQTERRLLADCRLDEIAALKLGINRIPFMIECPERGDCVVQMHGNRQEN